MALRLAGRGAVVTLIDTDDQALGATQRRNHDLAVVAAVGEALPFQPCSFDQVLVAQGMHLLAPGLALAEFARVLVADGWLAVAHTTRDDSVPWVRRLAGILQAHDPELMTGRAVEPSAALADNPYFPDIEYRGFRQWVPITRDGMISMVAGRLSALPAAEVAVLLDQVADLYDVSARPPDPLTLPYTVQCWRARVDHSEFTSQLDLADDSLRITL